MTPFQRILKTATAVVLFGPLAGQQPTGNQADLVSLSFTVKDAQGRHVKGLMPRDVVVSEDGITQTIFTFREGNGAPVLVAGNNDGTIPSGQFPSKPRFASKVREEDTEDAYTATYYAKPNRNTKYRTLKVQILPKGAGNWVTKHVQGYWYDTPDE